MLMRSSDTWGDILCGERDECCPRGFKGLFENSKTRLSGWTSWESLPQDTWDGVLSILSAPQGGLKQWSGHPSVYQWRW